MTLQEMIAGDLIEAQKGGARAKVSALRLIRAGVKNAEIARGYSLDDEGVIDIISKQVKRHRESVAEFTRGNRQDLVDREEAEMAALLPYLPKQMSRDEIVQAARQVIEQVGARGPGDRGKVMSQLMPQLKGKADGHEVSEVVVELISG